MAEKRMYSKKITDSDAFIEMPSAAQALYFHLNQGADDDGFNNQIAMAMYKAHASTDDLKILMVKNFVIRFESGIIVIKHWRLHNTLRKDRYVPTNYQEEFKMLGLKENGSYTFGCQVVAERLPQNSKEKNSKEECSVEENNTPPAPPSDDVSKTNAEEFEWLWSQYPRKEGKKAAFASYQRAKKKGVHFEDVRAGILNYLDYIKAKKIEPQFIKQGSTWFNGECWNDEYDYSAPESSPAQQNNNPFLDMLRNGG